MLHLWQGLSPAAGTRHVAPWLTTRFHRFALFSLPSTVHMHPCTAPKSLKLQASQSPKNTTTKHQTTTEPPNNNEHQTTTEPPNTTNNNTTTTTTNKQQQENPKENKGGCFIGHHQLGNKHLMHTWLRGEQKEKPIKGDVW